MPQIEVQRSKARVRKADASSQEAPTKIVNPSQTSPGFCVSFENTVGKGKMLVTSNFSFSISVSYSFEKLSPVFFKSEIVVCKLFQFGRV